MVGSTSGICVSLLLWLEFCGVPADTSSVFVSPVLCCAAVGVDDSSYDPGVAFEVSVCTSCDEQCAWPSSAKMYSKAGPPFGPVARRLDISFLWKTFLRP